MVSSAMLRSAGRRQMTWPRLVDEDLANADAAMRLEMVERLALVGGEWSRGVLERALSEEDDIRVRAAIEASLAQ